MGATLLKNARIVNEGKQWEGDLLIQDDRITKIASSISHEKAKVIDVKGHYLLPGMIDDQVHF